MPTPEGNKSGGKEEFLRKWDVCFTHQAYKDFHKDLDRLLASERERCAKMAEDFADGKMSERPVNQMTTWGYSRAIAETIRAGVRSEPV